MSFYTTPLQLGYFFSILMGIIFFLRSYREQRLSDFFLGALFILFAIELQDYTFGFSGINFLWEELNGFPRNISLLIGPCIYFYLQSQTNRNFKLRKQQSIHTIPFLIYFSITFFVFTQGSYAVQEFEQSTIGIGLHYFNWLVMLLSYSFYFYKSLKLYSAYKAWTIHHFSNPELIDFRWFRNFIYVMIAWIGSKELMHLCDAIFDLDFTEDWWWNLVIVVASFYVGLTAYSQRQARLLEFKAENNSINEETQMPLEKDETLNTLEEKLSNIMLEDRMYLQSELSLAELAKHLQVNKNQLSACINQRFKLNFNDYVNGLRVTEFERLASDEKTANYTLLALAFESGFNSKTTFNRAFKKARGISPKAYLNQLNS